MMQDLSKAECYYTSQSYLWIALIAGVLLLSLGVATLLGIEIPNVTPAPAVIEILLGVIGGVLIISVWPLMRYSGPTFAIAWEGLYLLLAGVHLELLEWNNVERFDSEIIRGRNGRIENILVYPKSVDLYSVRIEEHLGTVPFLVRWQFALHGEHSPFHVRVDTMKNAPDLQELLDHLDLRLAQHRAAAGQI
jgi:hypothetical protein